jgi:hypothetical protein
MTIDKWNETMNHLKSSSLNAIVHGFYHERRITPGRSREGFFGKEYFYSRAKYIGDGSFEYGPETEDHDWLESEEVVTRMRKSKADEDKVELTKIAPKILIKKGLIV